VVLFRSSKPPLSPYADWRQAPLVANTCRVRHIGHMEPILDQMARSLVESGDYRILRRLAPPTEYHPPDNSPKLLAAVVDVETTGTNSESDKIIELGIALFEYDRQSGRIYKILGSWEWFEDPGIEIPPEITKGRFASTPSSENTVSRRVTVLRISIIFPPEFQSGRFAKRGISPCTSIHGSASPRKISRPGFATVGSSNVPTRYLTGNALSSRARAKSCCVMRTVPSRWAGSNSESGA
jgi:hypothetical protein